jgi:undecaprenyl phosphate N,N'-diacetylbacillosamine 1-phosphate transferase
MNHALVQLQLALKRALDVSLSAALLLVLSPIMIAIAAAVRATSPGGALFRQTRVGTGGRPFVICKFRTMVAGAPQSRLYSHRDDPRVTRVGRVLRRTSLDELPQLLNILKGEMSFVGPRPDLPHHVDKYTEAQRQRLAMRPGVTGWAQVNGRNRLSWEERISLDLEYIRGWSLLRDLVIGFKTVKVVLTGDGVERPRPRSNP